VRDQVSRKRRTTGAVVVSCVCLTSGIFFCGLFYNSVSSADYIEAAFNLFVTTDELESLAQNGGHQPINVARFFFRANKYMDTKKINKTTRLMLQR
jgi:hypothetical protein